MKVDICRDYRSDSIFYVISYIQEVQDSEDDEVIVSSITFAASANCVLYCGAKPVFTDIDPETYNIDSQSVRTHGITHNRNEMVHHTDARWYSKQMELVIYEHSSLLCNEGARCGRYGPGGKESRGILSEIEKMLDGVCKLW